VYISNTLQPDFGKETVVSIYTDSGILNISAEIADNESERRYGLMFRESLGEYSGMLFVFDREQPVSFWMRNTIIPLDMVFINESLDIVGIQHNAEPCKADPCTSYVSGVPVKYVLETNGGFCMQNGVKEGNKIEITKL